MISVFYTNSQALASSISMYSVKSLNVGEDYDYSFDVNIPEQIAPAKYPTNDKKSCKIIFAITPS